MKITSSAGHTDFPWLPQLNLGRLQQPHQGKAVLPHGAAGARPCTGGASQGEGTESPLAAGCIYVDLGHTWLRISLVCLVREFGSVPVKNNSKCKNDFAVLQVGYSTALPKNVHLRPSPAGQRDMFGSVLRCMVLSLVLSRTRLIGSLTQECGSPAGFVMRAWGQNIVSRQSNVLHTLSLLAGSTVTSAPRKVCHVHVWGQGFL